MALPRFQPLSRLVLIGLAALCGCQPAAPVKVAFVGGLSGRVSELAIDGRNGTQLAIEALNARSGPRFELRVHDDAQSTEKGSLAIDEMADEGDAFAIGPMTSGLAKAMVPEASKRRLVLISPTANSDELGGMDDYFFRVIPPARPGAEQIAEAAVARGLRSASLLADWRNRSDSESFGNPPSQAAVFSYDATMMGAEGLRRKKGDPSLRDVLRMPGAWPGLQHPLLLDRFGDSISRFRLSEVRTGRFVMLSS